MDLNSYYKAHGMMTTVKTMKPMVSDLSKDIKEIVEYVQNILVHQHWASKYGVTLDGKRKQEPWVRSFEDKLIILNNNGWKHISEKKEPEDKMVGICRDFSVIAAALCREVGIPARARCGFASYFEKGKYVDHWIFEYWNDLEERWVMVDAQLDDYQKQVLNISFDSFDLTEKHFLTGPQAWLLCRNGEINPELFGIFEWWGYNYLKCNLLLDVNSLLKVPMQPWDGWGLKNKPIETCTEKDYKQLDALANLALNLDNNFNELNKFMDLQDGIKVPEDLNKVINYLK